MYNAIFFTEVTQEDHNGVDIPLGAFKVASCLRQKDYNVLVVNHYSKWTFEELKDLLNLVVNQETKLVGFSTTFLKQIAKPFGIVKRKKPVVELQWHSRDLIHPEESLEEPIVSYIKSINPNIKFCVGGAIVHPNFKNKLIDYAFIGYSETAIVNLMNHLSNGEELRHSYKNIYGVNIIDDRLAPDYDFVNDTMVWEDTDIVNHKVLPLELGRGCIFNCSFCSFPLRGKKNLDYLRHKEIIKNELLYMYEKYGIKHYRIVDDTFNDHNDKLLAFRDIVKSLPFQPYFWAYIRLDLLTTRPETIDLLYDIGIRSMYFGIETMNEKTGRSIGKGFSRDRQNQTISLIKEKYPDIVLHGSLIVGFTEDTPENIKNTFERLKNREVKLDTWELRTLILFKNDQTAFKSDFEEDPEAHGFYDIFDNTGKQWNSWKNKNWTFEEARNLAQSLMFHSYNLPHFMIRGEQQFGYVNYGYELSELVKTPRHKWNFDKVKNEDNPKFIDNYKRILLKLIQDKLKDAGRQDKGRPAAFQAEDRGVRLSLPAP